MVLSKEESNRLVELLLRAETIYLHKQTRIIFGRATFFGFLEVWRENRVDHIELVLQNTVLFLKLPDALEQFLFGRHSFIVHQ